jgi:hypothetical protein
MKSLKSLQIRLNEFVDKLEYEYISVSSSAFTQARKNLKHKAFIELNREAIVDTVYEEDYKTYMGFRLMAIDGSKLQLPNNKKIKKHFGSIKYSNEQVSGEHCTAVISVFYDILNHIAVDSIVGKAKSYEVDLAIEHLNYAQENDLIIFDRNYPSYRFLAHLVNANINFLMRCSRSSFTPAKKMFNSQIESQVVTLKPHHTQIKNIKKLQLPTEIRVRFVRVVLKTGEVEVLVTSLLDENLYPQDIFHDLYYYRWQIETFYGIVKTRLEVENFTGKTPESVLQDFYSTIFITGLESILTDDAQDKLDAKTDHNKYPQKVNKVVSFNTLKNHVIALFYQESSLDKLLDKLTLLFQTTPVLVREHREVPRKKKSKTQLLRHQKYKKKICF